jgi:uncharacterized membrane protein YedE/YeeE
VLEAIEPAWALTAAGLLIGGLFGAVAQRSHFCTMGAVSDLVLFGSRRRLRAWTLAIITALVGTQTLALAGLVPVGTSAHLAPRLFWLGAISGGLVFGFGMVLAGGCVSRALVRLGGGSLKALVVLLVTGISAFLIASGPLAGITGALVAIGSVPLPLPTGGLDAVLAGPLGLSPTVATLAATGLVLVPLAAFIADRRFLAGRADLATGVALGALVALGWLATATLVDPSGPAASAASLTFVAPTGGSIVWLMVGAGEVPGFGVATILGTVLGAALACVASGGVRLETFASRDDMLRHLTGGVLMGVGGALAGGCSIGQGVTGVSALSLQALMALAAILLGGVWGVKYLETGRLLPRLGRGAAAASAG